MSYTRMITYLDDSLVGHARNRKFWHKQESMHWAILHDQVRASYGIPFLAWPLKFVCIDEICIELVKRHHLHQALLEAFNLTDKATFRYAILGCLKHLCLASMCIPLLLLDVVWAFVLIPIFSFRGEQVDHW